MTKSRYIRLSLTALLSLVFIAPVQAQEVDFSCMKQRVRLKIQVSERYQEYDVIIENRCPGAVNWSLCLERMDPWTYDIREVLTPSGQIQPDKKTRVNLQMMSRNNEATSQGSFEGFYVNVAYGINSLEPAQCPASECEKARKGIRAERMANDSAWTKARQAVDAQVTAECSSTGWATHQQKKECEDNIRQASQTQLDQFAHTEANVLQKLASVNSNNCELHGLD